MHKVLREKVEVVDVDESYLYRTHKHMADSGIKVAPLPLPSVPLSGWEAVSQDNVAEIFIKVPHITSGMYFMYIVCEYKCYHSFFFYIGVVYTYLASGAGCNADEGTFQALSRGFIHWQSGRIDKLEICKCPASTFLSCSITNEAFHETRNLPCERTPWTRQQLCICALCIM